MNELKYTLKEAASLTGIPAATIKSKIHRNEIPSVQIPYGEGRYKLGVSAKGLELLLEKPGGEEYEKLMAQYLNELRSGIISKTPVSPSYIETIEESMRYYWRNIGKDKDIRHINYECLKQALMYYKVDEEKRIDKHSMKNKMYIAVTGFMRILIRDGYKTKTELFAMRELKPQKRFELKKKKYDAGYIKAVIEKNELWTEGRSDFDRKLWTTYIALLAYAGLRKMEPAQLLACKVFLDKKYMLVFGKGGVEDIVLILPSLLPYLQEWEKYRLKTSPYYFTTREGEPLTKSAIENRVKRFNEGDEEEPPKPGEPPRKKPKMKKDDVTISCHSLRYSFATLAAADNMPVPLIQKQLRHKRITTTQGYMMMDDTHLMEYGMKQYGLEPEAPKQLKEKRKREKNYRY